VAVRIAGLRLVAAALVRAGRALTGAVPGRANEGAGHVAAPVAVGVASLRDVGVVGIAALRARNARADAAVRAAARRGVHVRAAGPVVGLVAGGIAVFRLAAAAPLGAGNARRARAPDANGAAHHVAAPVAVRVACLDGRPVFALLVVRGADG